MGEIVENNTAPIDAPSRLPDYASPVPQPETNLNNPFVRVLGGTLHTLLLGLFMGAVMGALLGIIMLAVIPAWTKKPDILRPVINPVADAGYGCLTGAMMGMIAAAPTSLVCGFITFLIAEVFTCKTTKPATAFRQAIKASRRLVFVMVPIAGIAGASAVSLLTYLYGPIQIKSKFIIQLGPILDWDTAYILSVMCSFVVSSLGGAIHGALKESKNHKSSI